MVLRVHERVRRLLSVREVHKCKSNELELVNGVISLNLRAYPLHFPLSSNVPILTLTNGDASFPISVLWESFFCLGCVRPKRAAISSSVVSKLRFPRNRVWLAGFFCWDKIFLAVFVRPVRAFREVFRPPSFSGRPAKSLPAA